MKSWQDFHRAFGNTRTLVSSSLCKLSVPTDRSTSEPQTSAPPALYGAILGTAHSGPNKVEIYCPVCSTEAPCQLLRTDVNTHARCSACQTPPLSAWSLIQPHADCRLGACPLSAPPPVCVCGCVCVCVFTVTFLTEVSSASSDAYVCKVSGNPKHERLVFFSSLLATVASVSTS